MLEDIPEKDFPKPRRLQDVNISDYPAGSFVSYVCFDSSLSIRAAVLSADNPIKELLNRKSLRIKDLSDILGAPYRTVQDWASGTNKPPAWALRLIIDKVLR